MKQHPIGQYIRTRIADADTDEHGEPRAIPIGTVGVVTGMEPDTADNGRDLYTIAWENGGATRWTFAELLDDADWFVPL